MTANVQGAATICPECTEREVRLAQTMTGLFFCAACGQEWLFTPVSRQVDRQALSRMLSSTVFHCFDDEEFGLSAKHAVAVADAVLALLSTEEEK